MSREERTVHINLNAQCTFNGNYRKALARFLGVKKPKGYQWHTCHLCDNNSKSGSPCTNPLHLYYGTPQENEADKSPKARKASAKNMTSIVTCPHCGKTCNKMNAIRYHFDNCKQNPKRDPCQADWGEAMRRTVTCPHCGKTCNKPNAIRWHFDNCKEKR
jgi:hypothetical protein